MAEGDIWVSNILNDSSLVIGTNIDREEPAWQSIARGEQPAANELPVRIYAKYKDQIFDEKLPEFFMGGVGIQISQRLCEVFQQFNLGSAWILPVQLLLSDRQTPVDLSYFALSYPEKKSFLIVEECNGLRGRTPTRQRPNPPPPDKWGMPWDLKDGDISVLPSQLECLDFWSETNLRSALFFSDQMKQALCSNGYGKLFKFHKCKVLRVH